MITPPTIPVKSSKKPMSKTLKIILLILLGILVLCVVIVIISTSTPSGKATATANAGLTLAAKPTKTFIPTETSVPTETPVPTETSVPTETPVPTELPTSSIDEEGLIYLNKIQPLLVSVTDGLNDISEFSNLMAENPNLLIENDFVTNYFAVLDNIYEDMVEISDLTSPASFATSHNYLIEAKDEFFLVRSLLKSGINNLDVDDINAASDHLLIFSNYITLATEALGQ